MSATATFDFSGAVVLVTGGGSGIGRSVTRSFLDAGADVAVLGRRLERCEETLAGHPEERTMALACDVGRPEEVAHAVRGVVDRFGRLDVVVSNAALYVSGSLTDLDEATWASMRATNVDGTFHLLRHCLPHLEASSGSVVAVSSVSGERGDWGQAAYNATKGAVSLFVRSLALDYGARGVRINAVAPAFTLTDMTARVDRDPDSLAPFVNRVALGRLAEPDDIAPAVLYLASDAARYVTGVVLPVDGGTSASTGQPHL
ncbi:SDR family oxidoreductase [Nocardioides mangrovicus]|uniref:SDR family oxidoreductase n=1 Tax=Nocardioides mangrovicus TaxID=2478913 RepID=A0A3L8NXS8_9ACTN|nr:SDR family oxidoreductase [Nocardioides mangrovicus]RLV47975.1 SDR family oxidoreductase [Nocardioides mangrovicus]